MGVFDALWPVGRMAIPTLESQVKGGYIHEHPYLKVRRVVILHGVPSSRLEVSELVPLSTLILPTGSSAHLLSGRGRLLLLVASSPYAQCVFYSGHPSIEPPTASHSTVNPTLRSGARVSTPTRPQSLLSFSAARGAHPESTSSRILMYRSQTCNASH